MSPSINSDSFIAENSVISGDVNIGEKSSIWYGCVLRADVEKIRIGQNTNIQDCTVIHVTRANHAMNKTGCNGGSTIIGNNVTIGHGCIIHACKIQDDSFIGMGSILMDLSVMEKHSMLAAGSLLSPRKIVKSGELWAGRPAKFMRKLSKDELNYIQTSADNYWLLASAYK